MRHVLSDKNWTAVVDVNKCLEKVLGDPEVTANLYCNFAYLYREGCVICNIFAVTSGSPSMSSKIAYVLYLL